jgi:hypothetical protein
LSYTPAKKQTLLIASGTVAHPDKMHLFVIVTDKCDAGFHLLFSFCRIIAGVFHDPACVAKAGEHEFLAADSYVFYQKPEQLRHDAMIKCVGGWTYKPKADLSAALFERVCAGVTASRFTPRWAKDYFSKQSPKAPTA